MKELTIDNTHYTERELQRLASERLENAIESWEKELYRFILYWIDDKRNNIGVNTSGSTGKPKIIRITKEQMINSARMTLKHFGLNDGDCALLCLPVDYIAGKMMVVRAFEGRLNLVTVPPSSSPLAGMKTDYGAIDFCAMTPMQVHHSIGQESLKMRFQQIEQVIIGGGSISPSLRSIIEGFPNRIHETYGMTETVSHIATRQIAPVMENAFEVLPGIEIEGDENDCLVIYAPALTAEKLRTSDVVEIINDRQFTWKGRLDNVINSGGIKVKPEEMEKKISSLIDKRFIVSYVNDNISGQKTVLVIESKPIEETGEKRLLEDIKKRLDTIAYPRVIFYLDTFPETGFGKIDRKEILKLIG